MLLCYHTNVKIKVKRPHEFIKENKFEEKVEEKLEINIDDKYDLVDKYNEKNYLMNYYSI